MYMQSSLLALAALACQVLAFPLSNLEERDNAALDVQLSSAGNSMVKAVITNKGNEQLSFLKFDTPFDAGMTRKVDVTKHDSAVAFTGIFSYYDINNLPQEAFAVLAPGASLESKFDIAETHDLSEGGSFKVVSEGSLMMAKGTKVEGVAHFRSNELTMDVDGAEAAKVHANVMSANVDAIVEKRSRIDQRTCQGRNAQIVQAGLQVCVGYARAAAQAASSGHQKVQEFFKTNSPQTRQNIAARFQAIAQECSSSNGGHSPIFCQDVYNHCQPGLIAYTLFSNSHVAMCPGYFNLPAKVNQGYGPDHGYVIVHELTHAPAVFSPYTTDVAYGYQQSVRLSAQQAFGNADSYSLFAAGVARGA
ncbi:family M35 Zn2+-metallopeptidase [Emydomyces testavorans]|uniref:Neutral protease 2 n=1 Tax=Emydomyces testavorans TaxID=2070801 RepID=A0AAF0IM84_9EURO|nr:family M35 Zn2+-metallopeptidase [Emydomyces testavorans]